VKSTEATRRDSGVGSRRNDGEHRIVTDGDRSTESGEKVGRAPGSRRAVLALDPGTVTGWALWQPGRPVRSGTAVFRPGRFEGGGMRWLRFRRWLAELADMVEGGLAEVAFEEVRRHLGTDAAHVYGGFVAEITAFCEAHGIPYRGVPVGAVKRHATGRGNAPKDRVIEAMRARGFDPADDNEADALALLMLVLDERGDHRG